MTLVHQRPQRTEQSSATCSTLAVPRADLEEVPGTLTEAPRNYAAQGKLPEAASVPEIPGAGTLGKDSRILQLELPQGKRREPLG